LMYTLSVTINHFIFKNVKNRESVFLRLGWGIPLCVHSCRHILIFPMDSVLAALVVLFLS
jgi:hypothetical protein